jgi:CheY-like chemotaxis protein
MSIHKPRFHGGANILLRPDRNGFSFHFSSTFVFPMVHLRLFEALSLSDRGLRTMPFIVQKVACLSADTPAPQFARKMPIRGTWLKWRDLRMGDDWVSRMLCMGDRSNISRAVQKGKRQTAMPGWATDSSRNSGRKPFAISWQRCYTGGMPPPEDKALLVIDDDEEMHHLLRFCFSEDYDFQFASSGEDAMELAEKRNYPVVSLDLDLPGKSGMEILPELRRINPLQKIIILTGHASKESAISAMNQGAFKYIKSRFLTSNSRKSFRMVSIAMRTKNPSLPQPHLHFRN